MDRFTMKELECTCRWWSIVSELLQSTSLVRRTCTPEKNTHVKAKLIQSEQNLTEVGLTKNKYRS